MKLSELMDDGQGQVQVHEYMHAIVELFARIM